MITYDTIDTQNAISAVASSVAAIVPYVNAMAALPLGAKPIVVDGQTVGNWDPLSNIPGLENALQAAQQHCSTFETYVLSVLHGFPALLAVATGNNNGPGILYDLSTILNVLAQLVQSNAPPTAAQRQTVGKALQDLLQLVCPLAEYLAMIPGPTTTFVNQLSGDIQTLRQGSLSVSAAITHVQQSYENAVTQYAGAPGGSAIVAILETITQQTLGPLQAIEAGITAAASAEQPMVGALGKFQDIFTALGSDYSTTIQVIIAASDAQFASALQELDVQDAQSYWQNASAFATANGLEC